MKKPNDLRAYLIACVPELARHPQKLQVFIDAGTLQCGLQASLHFEYQYTLNVIITDMTTHADNVLVPLLCWLKLNQIDLEADAVKFEADILDHDTVDFSITVPLTERVLVRQNDAGNYTTEHLQEPVPEYNLPEPIAFKQLFADSSLMTQTDD